MPAAPSHAADQSMIGPKLGAPDVVVDEGHQAGRVGKSIVAEGDDRAFRPGIQLFDPGTAA